MGQHIVAIDLGTSKIVAMVAQKNPGGVLSILDMEKTESESSIRRGNIYNLENLSVKVSGLIKRLNSRMETKSLSIDKIYIGIGGQGLHSVLHSIKKEVQGEAVSRELLDEMEKELEQFPDYSLIRKKFPPEYYSNGERIPNPVGANCSVIEARYLLILGRPLERYKAAIEEKTNVTIAGFFVSSLATAESVLNDTEKETGCALVEFGAGVTSVSVYKSGNLKYLVTIPLGSAVITKDICSLDIPHKKAEDFKVNSGSAFAGLEEEAEDKVEDLSEEGKLKALNKIVAARMDEILENVIEQISHSGYAQSIRSIVITGGGALLRDLPEVIRQKTGKEVRLANAKRNLVNQAPDWSQSLVNACVVGLLAMGKEDCLKEQERKSNGNLFGEGNQPPPVTEEEKKRKEEEKKKLEQQQKEARDREKQRQKEEADRRKKREGPGLWGRIWNDVTTSVDKISEELLNPEKSNPEGNTPDKNDNNKQ